MNAQALPLADRLSDMIQAGQYHEAEAAALAATGSTFSVKPGSGKLCPFGDRRMAHYRFSITNARGTYRSDFWQSVNASAKGLTPTAYDILACLQWFMYEENVVDFANAYGYKNGKEAVRTFNACQRQVKGLSSIFTQEEREALAQIA